MQKLGERVVLGKSCPLRILLQNMASIQPRTSPCIFKIFENFKNLNFQKFSKFSKIFENRWTRSGAKAGGTGRSRQELPVAYFVAKFVLHPAENEPRQDCKFSANFRKFRRRCRLLRRPFRKFLDADRCKSSGTGRSLQELPVAYFVAKFGLHPAENEPRQVWQILADFRH